MELERKDTQPLHHCTRAIRNRTLKREALIRKHTDRQRLLRRIRSRARRNNNTATLTLPSHETYRKFKEIQSPPPMVLR